LIARAVIISTVFPMKNFVRGIVFTIIVLAIAGWLYVQFGFADFRANVPPSWLESQIVGLAVRASVARHTWKEHNPIQPTDANLLDGARLYRDKCADCHGRPDNPVSDYGMSFYPPAPQFMKMNPRLSDSQTFYVVKYGVRRSAMPAWGGIMADTEIWQVVALLSRMGRLPPDATEELHRPALSTP
jgi:mono/diheme cytochrome c family protein